jgi:hypothetical protein
MKFSRMLLQIVGATTLVIILGAVVAPKAARGVAAALVQVTNTSANPVPVTAVQLPAVQVTAFSGPEASNGAADVHGPFDVSGYSTIRLSAGGSGPTLVGFCIVNPNNCVVGTATYGFVLVGSDSNGNSYVLDAFSVQGGLSTSRSYELPGTSVQVQVSVSCNGGCGSPTANFAIFGR